MRMHVSLEPDRQAGVDVAHHERVEEAAAAVPQQMLEIPAAAIILDDHLSTFPSGT